MNRADAGPRDIYSQRLESRRASLAANARRLQLLGYLQVAILLGALAAILPALHHAFSIAWEAVPAAAFVTLSFSHDWLVRISSILRRAVRYFERGLLRLDGKWSGAGDPGVRYLDPAHPYAQDLDLFGNGSLFELLCTARTPMGQNTLAGWLMEPAIPAVIRARQEAVVELAPRVDLREDIAVLAENAREGVHTEALFAWGEREPLLEPSPFRIVACGLSVLGATAVIALTAILLALLGLFRLPEKTMAGMQLYCLFMGIVYTAILGRFKKRTNRIIDEIDAAGYDLSLIAGVLRRVESERFMSPLLTALRAKLDTEGLPASRRIAKLNRLIELADSRRNMAVKVIGPLLLWDLHLSYAIENWRRVSGPAIRPWLNAVGEIEAISSLAGYYYEHPRDVFPEFTAEQPCFEATAIGHPLLDENRVVRSDVRLGGELRFLVVSGSNMSGKSTLLRTLGINAVLAQTGAPVRANRLIMSPLAIEASIRITDSLHSGVSRFYAEILRIRQIVNLTSGLLPVFFLVDEFCTGPTRMTGGSGRKHWYGAF